MSGGQKQRVAIARALAKKAVILILDEATSAIDNLKELHLRNSLKNLNMTIISIAHRIEAIRGHDSIIILENGKITARGNDRILSRRAGLYRSISMLSES